jgi:hypothetical protein
MGKDSKQPSLLPTVTESAGSRADNMERAIEFSQAALTVLTFEDFPENWAMTQNNLAYAYSNRINGSRADNIERRSSFIRLL